MTQVSYYSDEGLVITIFKQGNSLESLYIRGGNQ